MDGGVIGQIYDTFVRWRLATLQLWVEIATANQQNLGIINNLAEGELQTCWSVNTGTILQLCKSAALWRPTQWIDVFHLSANVPIEPRWTKHHSTEPFPSPTCRVDGRLCRGNGFRGENGFLLWLPWSCFSFFVGWFLKVASGTLCKTRQRMNVSPIGKAAGCPYVL